VKDSSASSKVGWFCLAKDTEYYTEYPEQMNLAERDIVTIKAILDRELVMTQKPTEMAQWVILHADLLKDKAYREKVDVDLQSDFSRIDL